MRKKLICIAVTVCLIISCLPFRGVFAQENIPSVSAECAVMIDAVTGEVLYSKSEDLTHSMASTTKIMTAVVAIELGDLDKEYTLSNDMIATEGSSLGLKSGDKITLYDLLCGMMLESGNDAANAVANIIGGSLPEFADLMNAKAKEIGMKSSSFVTPSGLDAEEHYSTAYDMAVLTRYALQNEIFSDIVSRKSMTVSFGDPKQEHTVSNHNRLLSSYDGAVGVKTGFTKKSGRCLVSAAERNGVRLIAVTLNDKNDWKDHTAMLDYGFSLTNSIELDCSLPDSDINVVGGDRNSTDIYAIKKEINCATKGDLNLTKKIILPRFVYTPINQGEKIGKVLFYQGDTLIAETPICAYTAVNAEAEHAAQYNEGGLLSWIKNLIS